MEFVALPFFLITLYLFYDTKPVREDEIGIIWEEENLLKRIKIKDIISEYN
tara:strand:+ start:198 stop:350 length:153 start_codon:yes stop_codon:yes gene_type:complete